MIEKTASLRTSDLDGERAVTAEAQLLLRRSHRIGLAEQLLRQLGGPIHETVADVLDVTAGVRLRHLGPALFGVETGCILAGLVMPRPVRSGRKKCEAPASPPRRAGVSLLTGLRSKHLLGASGDFARHPRIGAVGKVVGFLQSVLFRHVLELFGHHEPPTRVSIRRHLVEAGHGVIKLGLVIGTA